ncbi:hypothetical protein SDJN03_28106, partial [Cucurbita argyrosperma subsp. sororia]
MIIQPSEIPTPSLPQPRTYGAFSNCFPSGLHTFLSFQFNSPVFPPFPCELGRSEYCNQSSVSIGLVGILKGMDQNCT